MAKKNYVPCKENVEAFEQAVAEFRRAKLAAEQWTEYKRSMAESLFELCGVDADALELDLFETRRGSCSFTLGGVLDGSFSLEMTCDQGKASALAADAPELVGLALKEVYKPGAPKDVMGFMGTSEKYGERLKACIKMARRGPYLTTKKD